MKKIYKKSQKQQFYQQHIFLFLQDEYNLNPGLEWEDEFTGRFSPMNFFERQDI